MKSIDLLIRRGFLIEQNEHGYYLSDNSHPNDKEYLEELLESYKIGHFDPAGTIVMEEDSSASKALLSLFAPVEKGTIGVGTSVSARSWSNHVRRRFHSPKIPVSWLEPNIAAYIKALSACGIYTGGSCDGNHQDTAVLSIDIEYPYQYIHKAMWEYHLNHLFHLNWNRTYSKIGLKRDRQGQYDELFRASQYIYDNRWNFIDARLDSAKWLTRNAIKKTGEQEIRHRFIEEFEKSLKLYFSN